MGRGKTGERCLQVLYEFKGKMGFLRISYAYSLDALKEAIKRIEIYIANK